MASEQAPYEQLIDLLQQQHARDPSAGGDRAAFEASERARARVLLDSLLDGRVDLHTNVDPEMLQRERSLQSQLSDASAQLSRTLAAGATATQSASAVELVNRLTGEYQDLQAQIRRRNPRYASATLPERLTAAEIQERVLDPDTVLLEYALGEERSWLWAVTSEGITSVELPARPAIESAARSLYEALTARQPKARESAAVYADRIRAADARLDRERATVGQMLLGGVAQQLSREWAGKRLVIVATGVLEYVPFGALVAPGVRTNGVGSRREAAAAPLAARHEIVNVPSASVLSALRRDVAGRAPARHAVAVLADPVFELTDPRVRKPTTPPSSSTGRRPLAVNQATTRGELTRLPFTREEASSIAALVPGRDVFQATDFTASRTTVLGGALSGYRVVHFATHGVFDARSPALSGLVLSLVDERGRAQDGFLRLNDIYNMQLDADLVVLSACQTALGKETNGEGLVGIARAFMHAGAPRVVASLWQVSDLATAELMKKFYRYVLAERRRPAAALRAAQLEMSRDPRWQSPYYWAGFVLQGDWK